MSGETYLTIIGTMVEDAELRYTPNGAGVANFRVAVNARKFNKTTNEWEKKPAKFWRCQVWNQGKALMADNVANTLKKGDTVIVYGEIETREFETREGEKRSVDEIRVEAVGKDLRWHQAAANNVQPYTDPTRPGASAPQSQGWGGQTTDSGWGNTDEPTF